MFILVTMVTYPLVTMVTIYYLLISLIVQYKFSYRLIYVNLQLNRPRYIGYNYVNQLYYTKHYVLGDREEY